MVDADNVMDNKQKLNYTLDRKLHKDPSFRKDQLKNLKTIKIHNAFREEELIDILKAAEVWKYIIPYTPPKSTETHFYDNNNAILHIPNGRGNIRLIRDLRQCDILKAYNPDIETIVNNYGKNPSSRIEATKRFQDFAHDLASECYSKIPLDRIKKDIYVIIGPHPALKLSQDEITDDTKNDFLNYRIASIDKKVLINFDYIFADQITNVLDKLCSITNDMFNGITMHIMHYGKVGSLVADTEIGDIIIPTGGFQENDMQNGEIIDNRANPIRNMLTYDNIIRKEFEDHVYSCGNPSRKIIKGSTLNSNSVLNQKKSTLEKAKAMYGCHSVEMEWLATSRIAIGYNTLYPNISKIKFYFAGAISDIPLEEKTLANTEFSNELLVPIASFYKSLIGR